MHGGSNPKCKNSLTCCNADQLAYAQAEEIRRPLYKLLEVGQKQLQNPFQGIRQCQFDCTGHVQARRIENST
jgi:hypothetical protein